jgi:CBS domain-containing protein
MGCRQVTYGRRLESASRRMLVPPTRARVTSPDQQENFEMIATTELRVGDVMSFNPVVIGPDEPLAEAERLIKTYRVSGLPVVEDGLAIGVVSQTDLGVARSSSLISANWSRMRVRHVMTAPAATVHIGTSTEHAARLMLTRHIHRLVVIDDEDRAIGVVSSLDLLRTLVDDPDVL